MNVNGKKLYMQFLLPHYLSDYMEQMHVSIYRTTLILSI